MGARKDSVNYITWGILLILGAVVLFFTKILFSFLWAYKVIGGILVVSGVLSFKKKPLPGVILIASGLLMFFGHMLKIFSVVGWLVLAAGGIMIFLGVAKVKS